jgi:hypothetical protein
MLSSEVDLFAHCRFLSSANAFAIMEPRFGRVTSVTSKRVPPVQEVRLRQLEASPKIYATELDRVTTPVDANHSSIAHSQELERPTAVPAWPLRLQS